MEPTLWDTYFHVGRRAFEEGDLSQAQEAFAAAVDAAREQPKDARLALSLNNLAAVRQAQGDVAGAIELTEQALNVSRETFGDRHAEVGMGWANLAELLSAGGRYAEAEGAYLAGLEILKQVGDQPYWLACQGYAQMLLSLERLPAAAEILSDLRKGLESGEPETTEWLSQTLHLLANVNDAVRRPDEARECRKACLERLRRLWGAGFEVAEVMLNMAESLVSNERFADAADLYVEAAQTLERAFPPDDPRLTSAQLSAVACLKEAGRLAEAEQEADRLVAAWKPEHEAYPRLLNERGLIAFLQDRFEEAVGYFQRALAGWCDAPPPTRISCLYNLGSAELGAGNREAAREHLDRALTLAQEHLAPEHPMLARIRHNQGRL